MFGLLSFKNIKGFNWMRRSDVGGSVGLVEVTLKNNDFLTKIIKKIFIFYRHAVFLKP